MKISLSDLLIPTIVIGVAGWWGYSKWSDRVEKNNADQVRLEASSRAELALAEMARRHQATRALTAKLAEGSGVFTYQVQNALSAATGKAVLVSCHLADIEKRDGLFVLHLNDASAGGVVIRYVLECDPQVAEALLGQRAGAPTITAVVQISSVEKAEVNLRRGTSAGREPSLALDDSAPFIAYGRCLEIVVR